MAELRCPACKSDDVNVHLEANASGELIAEETYAQCKKCGSKLTLEQLKAALGLK